MNDTAYKTAAPAVLEGWRAFKATTEVVRERRKAFGDRYGRNLMVNRLGFGHGTRVVGLEQLDTDTDGDIFGENGEWRVPKKGPPYRTATPNTRRKAGKDVAAELATLTEEGPRLTGMPPFHLVGFHCLAPALFEHRGVVWALWPEDISETANVDTSLWERAPLSAYHAAHEAYEAAS